MVAQAALGPASTSRGRSRESAFLAKGRPVVYVLPAGRNKTSSKLVVQKMPWLKRHLTNYANMPILPTVLRVLKLIECGTYHQTVSLTTGQFSCDERQPELNPRLLKRCLAPTVRTLNYLAICLGIFKLSALIIVIQIILLNYSNQSRFFFFFLFLSCNPR